MARLPLVLATNQIPAVQDGDEAVGSSGRHILVADDNVDSAESLGSDGLQALEVAEKFRPDVILLDVRMPKLNGYEAAHRIRAQAWGRDTVLVALTGWGKEDDRKKSSDAGFDHHFVKPVEITVLVNLLVGLLKLNEKKKRHSTALPSAQRNPTKRNPDRHAIIQKLTEPKKEKDR